MWITLWKLGISRLFFSNTGKFQKVIHNFEGHSVFSKKTQPVNKIMSITDEVLLSNLYRIFDNGADLSELLLARNVFRGFVQRKHRHLCRDVVKWKGSRICGEGAVIDTMRRICYVGL